METVAVPTALGAGMAACHTTRWQYLLSPSGPTRLVEQLLPNSAVLEGTGRKLDAQGSGVVAAMNSSAASSEVMGR